MNVPLLRAIAGLFTLVLSAPLAATDYAQPNPDLAPEQIVQVQLDALKAGGDSDLAVVFQFASPPNQAATGPAERFVAMLKSSFGMMVSHQIAHLGPLFQQGDEAMQPVALIDRNGQPHRFVWMLQRYDLADCEGCWFTDGVVPPEAISESYDPMQPY